MTILPGFEDLHPRDVLSFNGDGTVTVVVGDKVKRYKAQMQPTGSICYSEVEHSKPDQVTERERVPVALRWANTDQGASALARGEIQ